MKIGIKIIVIMFLAIYTIGILLSTGCSEYKTFTIDKKDYKCSFEYPRSYERDTYSNGDYFNVSLSLPLKGYKHKNPAPFAAKGDIVTMFHTPSVIDVSVWGRSTSPINFTTPQDYLDDLLRRQESAWESHKLLERSQLLVSGINCEYAFYTDGVMAMNPDNPIKYYKWIIFENNGSLYFINSVCESDAYEQAIQDFQHVLSTFTVIY